MLNIIYTNTTLEGHRGLYRCLAKNDKLGGKHIVIVPDRFTLGVERELCEYYFHDGMNNVNVTSMTRLAVKTLGKRVKKCLSKEGTVLLLYKVIKENNDKLEYYKNIRNYAFSKEMFAAIAALRNSGITPDNIEEKINGLKEGTAKKLRDIAVVYRAYCLALNEKYADTITRIDALIDWIGMHDFSDTHIYFLGFNIFSEQQKRLMKAFLRACPSVNVALVKSFSGTNENIFPQEQLVEIIELCKYYDIPIKTETAFEQLNPPYNIVNTEIFGFGKKTYCEKDKEKIRLVKEQNPYEEISAVAAEINYLVKNSGLRYKDISLVANNNEYLPIIKEIFSRCGIPCFLEESYYVKNGLALKFIFALLGAVAEDYSYLEIKKVLSHPFSSISTEEAIAYENYAEKYNINYEKILMPFNLGNFAEAEAVRKKVIELLKLVPKSNSLVNEYCTFIKNILQQEEIVKLLEKYVSSTDGKLIASGKTELIFDALDGMSEVLGGETADIGSILAVLKAIFDDTKISILPAYIDTVFVGNSSESRYSEQKAIFIVGANAGYFPLQSGDGLIFSAVDNLVMQRGGLPIYPSPMENNGLEMFVAADMMTKAENLYVCYADFSILGERLTEGEAVKELSAILVTQAKHLVEYRNFSNNEKLVYGLINPQNTYFKFMQNKIPEEYNECIREYLLKKGFNVTAIMPSDNIIKADDFFRKDDKGRYVTSVSQLERYFHCPYAHFLDYNLKLHTKEGGELKANVIGTITHNILEAYFKNHLESLYEGNVSHIIDKVINDELCKAEYDCYRNDPMNNYVLRNVSKECKSALSVLTENLRNSRFKPTFFEKKFGYSESDVIEISAGGKLFSLRGKIDRVDFYNKNVCVIDYKTGAENKALKYIYYGSKIQLYVYLSYFLKQGYIPAGAFYLPIKGGYAKGGRTYTLDGQMRNDTDIMFALDGLAEKCEDGRYNSPVVCFNGKKTNGEWKFNKADNLLEENEFYLITDYVQNLIETALLEIAEGYIEKSPLKDTCDNCNYSTICGKVGARDFCTLKKDAFTVRKEEE